MSDTVLVAIVGIVAAVLGGALGATVSGLIAYRIARLNGETQLRVVREQLEQANEQARRTLVVEARKTYLLPIREQLAGILGATMTIPTVLLGLKQALDAGLPPDSESVGGAIEQLKQAGNTMAQDPAKVFASMGQVSDQALTDRIDAYFVSLGDMGQGLQRVFAVTKDGDVDVASLTPRIVELIASLDTVRPKAISVNQRIVELLSGD